LVALGAGTVLNERSALFDSFRRGKRVLRLAKSQAAAAFAEDRMLGPGGLAAYLCVPLNSGAIAVATRRVVIDSAQADQVEALVKRLVPSIDKLVHKRDADAGRALVRNLALRLYGAIDSERARIARDLHDDQAQLLAAARIALEARPEKAKAILREAEQRLRSRLKTLRPATLGGSTLKGSLESEIQRLEDAGIEARLLRIDGARGLDRSVQNLCYQVACEAVSNVIRHSRAAGAEISLERVRDRVVLSISDDGRGIGPRKGRGMGLSGIADRVELIGGRLTIDTHPGRTRIVAEIPVAMRIRANREQSR